MKRFALCLLALLPLLVSAQDKKPPREVTIHRKDGTALTGTLVKVEGESAVVAVKDLTVTVPLDTVTSIMFGSEKARAATSLTPVSPSLATRPSIADVFAEEVFDAQDPGITKPVILHKERAKYTPEARDHGVEGVVVLSAVFTAGGKITEVRAVRSLPDGLTENAIEALQKIRFKPGGKDGKPVSVRMRVEYNFALDRSR